MRLRLSGFFKGKKEEETSSSSPLTLPCSSSLRCLSKASPLHSSLPTDSRRPRRIVSVLSSGVAVPPAVDAPRREKETRLSEKRASEGRARSVAVEDCAPAAALLLLLFPPTSKDVFLGAERETDGCAKGENGGEEACCCC